MPHKINFDFAQIPAGTELKLSEIGMLASRIEDIVLVSRCVSNPAITNQDLAM